MSTPLIPRDAVLDLLRSRLVRARSSEEDAPAAAYLAEVLECVGCMAPVAAAVAETEAERTEARIGLLRLQISETEAILSDPAVGTFVKSVGDRVLRKKRAELATLLPASCRSPEPYSRD